MQENIQTSCTVVMYDTNNADMILWNLIDSGEVEKQTLEEIIILSNHHLDSISYCEIFIRDLTIDDLESELHPETTKYYFVEDDAVSDEELAVLKNIALKCNVPFELITVQN